MARIWLRLALLLTLLSLLVGVASAQSSRLRRQVQQQQMQAQKPQTPKKVTPAPAPVPTQTAAPALEVQVTPPVPTGPPKPVDMPAVPPQVSFVQGQLLIVAQNSTLGDILDAVHKSTGATIDIASGDTSERVVGRIGPGIARDVLTDLLNGSKFNYVMVSPTGDATALDKVILTPKTITLASNSASGPVGGSVPLPTTSSGPVFTPAPLGTTPNRQLLQQLQPQVMPVGSQPPTADEDANNDSSDDQDQAAPGSVPPGQATETAPPAPQNPATMQEQMIQELQRRYQDRVNMQQKQNQPNQNQQNQQQPPPQ